MSIINIVDGFKLGASTPIDDRIVAANSIVRNSITYKYNGLKVFQLDNRVEYIWNSGTSVWDLEPSGNVNTAATATVRNIPLFSGTNSVGNWILGASLMNQSLYGAIDVNGGVNLMPNTYFGFNIYWNSGFYRSASGYSAYFKQEPSGYLSLSTSTTTGVGGSLVGPLFQVIGADNITTQIDIGGNSGFEVMSLNATTKKVSIWGDVGMGRSPVSSTPGNKYSLSVEGLSQFNAGNASYSIGGYVVNVGATIFQGDVHLNIGQVTSDGSNHGAIQVTGGGNYGNGSIGTTAYHLRIQPGGGQTLFNNGSLSSPSISFNSAAGTGLYITSSVQLGFAISGVNKMTISNNDIYANIHNSGINGIGDSGNSATPWVYPSISSGQRTLTSGDFTLAINCSLPFVRPCAWHRTGNVVTVSGQVGFTVTTLGLDTSFSLKVPVNSIFGVDTGGGDGNNWRLNGIGKIVGKYGSVGDVSTIQAYDNTANFKFRPSSSGYQVMAYQYTYIVGTYPNSGVGGGVGGGGGLGL